MEHVVRRGRDELPINGAGAASTTGTGYAADVGAIGYPALVGGTPRNQCLLGDIAEVVAVKGPMTQSELRGLEAYLMAKSGL